MPVEYSGVNTVILSETKAPKEEKENRKQLRKLEYRRKQKRFSVLIQIHG